MATGKTDVLVNGVPMSRLMDHVLCAGPPSPGEGGALVDHGPPDSQVGPYDVYVDGKLVDVPAEDLERLAKAVDSGDPQAIAEAFERVQPRGGTGNVKWKLVDREHPNHPNEWVELESTGPGFSSNQDPLNPAMPRIEQKQGGGRIRAGGSVQEVGVKVTGVRRYEEDGAIKESRRMLSAGKSEGASIDLEWSDERKGIAIDTPWVVGAGGEEVVIKGAVGRLMPALDEILWPVSGDVLIGG